MTMSDAEKQDVLQKASAFFRNEVIKKHVKNTKKLSNEKRFEHNFEFNPFTLAYIAKFSFGDTSPESLAKALVYPRVMGTSIATSFGSAIQRFSSKVLSAYASTTAGMDIEYKDSQNQRHIYCQLKAGPQTINKDDVKTICDHFSAVGRLKRTNGSTDFNPSTDCVVGVLYGTPKQLSANYKRIKDENYRVLIGKEFWTSLTGDDDFYEDLITAMVNSDSTGITGVIGSTLDQVTQFLAQNPDIIPTPSDDTEVND
ncbi:Type II restriction endonuclease EcoO109I [Bifidobacterium bohemicum]|uniref:Putative MjaII restriction endonuclease superfamily protein n=1 Tax=Bifidobacterium bohemicum DSM 22767 TaxID=1437606 RepID=A0A086ZE17_9BIFI|nr:PmeII family type II restriction endonuclease [Bifidobacterium bohemicum]KFI44767.1 putative MjaII restriction endonuclease superfamily protein [Bifidobacterium bohemicum DSM 22767]SCC19276.1 Type II restriction endonuclease EcoO109I [Bifidobacterium bohemicum]